MVESASGLPSLASMTGLSGGTITTPPVAASVSVSSRILASCSRLALARLRSSRLLRLGLASPACSRQKFVRNVQVAPTERPMI